jgi:ferric-dicitrate binding protein FerR (iron transport regulator)
VKSPLPATTDVSQDTNTEADKRDEIIQEALKVKESSKQDEAAYAAADYALNEVSEIRRAEERRGLEDALKTARELEQRRKTRRAFAAVLAFVIFMATAIIAVGSLGLLSTGIEVVLALLVVGGLGFAALAFFATR